MKLLKQPAILLIAFIAILLGYGVLTTLEGGRLEKRVNLLEENYAGLQTRHRAFARAMLHAADSPESVLRAKMELLMEDLNLPPSTVHRASPSVTEVNSLSIVVRTKQGK